jgi:hypothetical protein
VGDANGEAGLNTLYIIDPLDTFEMRALEQLPNSRDLEREFFGGQWSEHVVCLWGGKRAHAFVDETGALKQLPVNLRASALYQNATRVRQGFQPYDDLAHDPGPYVFRDIPLIYGRMLFWPASARGWEPEHAPWPEYARAGA